MSERKITRWEYLQNMTAREAGHYFCSQFGDCDECPMEQQKRCRADESGRLNGFIEWLKGDYEG